MSTNVVIPDFDFSGYYYPQILEALVQYKRRNVPELTDESAYEPFIQFLRMTALVGHLNNTLLDLVANEGTLPTAKLTESVRNMLRLIDYELQPAAPSQVDLVYELSKVFTTAYTIISARAQSATQKDANNAAVYFEALEALAIDRTDLHSKVWSVEDGVFTDRTSACNSDLPASDFSPWATPAMNDAIYWGHKQAMWDRLGVLLASVGANIQGVWEYYDGNLSDSAPTSVTDLGATLKYDLTSLLGTNNRQGSQIRIQLNETTAFEDVETTWDGAKNVATTGLLGQSSPETDPTKYTVGMAWKILSPSTDEVLNFAGSGKLEYALPQTVAQDWKPIAVNGFEAYWLRYRVISVSTPTSPIIRRTRMDDGKQYVLRSATQGRTRNDTPLGSSTGLPNQRFETTKEYFINGSEEVTVDTEIWTLVGNFLNSQPADRHYTVELGENDRATIVFGDGVNGRIPPIGVGNVGVTYRYEAQNNGNVGANTITIDKTGLTFINKQWNPRQATGWSEAQGANAASLERAKIEGPASLRTREVAVGPDDVEKLAVAFVDEDGSKPVSRALAIEEGFGPKTIELVIVLKGGGYASASQIQALTDYFNGDKFANPPKEKHLVANQEVVVVNYTPKVIDIAATVKGIITVEEITNRLSRVVQPEALKDDGTTYEWKFGSEVPRSRLSHEIFDADESITDVILSTPAADIDLLTRELPVLGSVSITVVEP